MSKGERGSWWRRQLSCMILGQGKGDGIIGLLLPCLLVRWDPAPGPRRPAANYLLIPYKMHCLSAPQSGNIMPDRYHHISPPAECVVYC